MENLFHCKTINQFRICAWLAAQDITKEDIFQVELVTGDEVRITNAAGQYMDLIYQNGEVTIV